MEKQESTLIDIGDSTTSSYIHAEVDQRVIDLCILTTYYENGTVGLRIGGAVCMPEDEYRHEMGVSLATGRAFLKTKPDVDFDISFLGKSGKERFIEAAMKSIAETYITKISDGFGIVDAFTDLANHAENEVSQYIASKIKANET